MRIVLLVAALIVPFTGCATILSGPSTAINVESNVPGAQILVDGALVGSTPAANVPTTVIISKNSRVLEVRADGYQPASIGLQQNLGVGWLILDIILTGLLGVVVDAITGAWHWVSPNNVYATLEPR